MFQKKEGWLKDSKVITRSPPLMWVLQFGCNVISLLFSCYSDFSIWPLAKTNHSTLPNTSPGQHWQTGKRKTSGFYQKFQENVKFQECFGSLIFQLQPLNFNLQILSFSSLPLQLPLSSIVRGQQYCNVTFMRKLMFVFISETRAKIGGSLLMRPSTT